MILDSFTDDLKHTFIKWDSKDTDYFSLKGS